MDKINILDCTLRDGGYVNNWEFRDEDIVDIINMLKEANIDVIECGIFGETPILAGTRFYDLRRFEEKLQLDKNNTHTKYAVMLNCAEKDKFTIKKYNGGIDIIRLAFFKQEYKEAVKYANKLMELGYKVYMQAMATAMYGTYELRDLMDTVNNLKPEAFYMVDSFGSMSSGDVEYYCNHIRSQLDRNIVFGFHGHDNTKQALSHTLKFIKTGACDNRNIIVDSSVFGMGRGAGNCKTEVLINNLNNIYNPDEDGRFDSEKIIEIYNKHLHKIYCKSYWGYTPSHYLAGKLGINSAYIWYMKKLGIKTYGKIELILSLIPKDIKHYLNKPFVDKIAQYMVKDE